MPRDQSFERQPNQPSMCVRCGRHEMLHRWRCAVCDLELPHDANGMPAVTCCRGLVLAYLSCPPRLN